MRPNPWLDLAGLLDAHRTQLDAVPLATAPQFVQDRQLRGVLRHHQLTAPVDPQTPLVAVARQPRVTLPAEAGLEAVFAVVETGVQDPAVTGAGVLPELRLLLEQDDPRVREAAAKLDRDTQTDDATADDQEVCGVEIGQCYNASRPAPLPASA